MAKKVTYVNVAGYEIEKIVKPYGVAPRGEKKFKKGAKVRRDTIRGQ